MVVKEDPEVQHASKSQQDWYFGVVPILNTGMASKIAWRILVVLPMFISTPQTYISGKQCYFSGDWLRLSSQTRSINLLCIFREPLYQCWNGRYRSNHPFCFSNHLFVYQISPCKNFYGQSLDIYHPLHLPQSGNHPMPVRQQLFIVMPYKQLTQNKSITFASEQKINWTWSDCRRKRRR